MVFGELIGGALGRAGERFNEERLRKQRIQEWQQAQDLALQQDFFRTNYANMTPEQQEAWIGAYAPKVGMRPKDMSHLIGGVRAIGSIIPPQYMRPEALGPATPPTAPPTVTPSQEAPVTVQQGPFAGQSIAAPASISLEQVPQPGAIGTPSIYQPIAGHRAAAQIPLGQPTPALRAGEQIMSQTPNQVLAQRKFDQEQAERAQNIANIRSSGLKPELIEAGVAGQYKIPAVPIITSQIGAASREAIEAGRQAQIKATPRFVIRGDQQLPVYRRGQIETYFDPEQGQEVQYHFQSGDRVYEKSATTGGIQLIQDDRGTYAVNKAAAMAGTPGAVAQVPGLGGRPQPQSQAMTISGPEGSKVVEFTPKRGGGGGTVRTIKENAMKGYSESTQSKLDQLETIRSNIDTLNQLIQKPHVQGRIGPMAGRFTNIQREFFDVGGTPEQGDDINETFRITQDLSDMLLRARSGAQINEAEYSRLRKLTPNPNSPLPRFNSDLRGFTRALNVVLQRRGLPPIQLGAGVSNPPVGSDKAAKGAARGAAAAGGDSLRVTLPNGKVYNFKTKEEADKFRAAAGIK